MAHKRTTKSSSATTTTTTTSVIDAQLKALIDQGIAKALAARDADRSRNGEDSHDYRMGVRRQTPPAYLKKKMTDKYCPRVEIKKLEFELSNLKVKGTDMIGLPNMIHESVVASKPKTMQEAIEMETELMDKKIFTFVERQTENKRKQDDNNNQAQQQPLKKQGVAIAYTAGPGERKEYAGTLPLYNKCKFHHNGHYRSDCPQLKNQDHRNQDRGTGAHGMVHALEGGETNQDLNVVEDDINA
uniref:Reverse transcriptase domain-containing protein n=1 Tax=Tanacetum cinerariifolium TaxID=118510 RepID=A0A699JFB3_TANCI|nr:hypothetical protein [Tanacetum cinerariifolium]